MFGIELKKNNISKVMIHKLGYWGIIKLRHDTVKFYQAIAFFRYLFFCLVNSFLFQIIIQAVFYGSHESSSETVNYKNPIEAVRIES